MSLQKSRVKKSVAGILIDLHFHKFSFQKKATKIAAVIFFYLSVLRN